MQNMLNQFYNEGFAVFFYQKPLGFINRKVKSERTVRVLSVVIKVLYTLFVLTIAGAKLWKDFKKFV